MKRIIYIIFYFINLSVQVYATNEYTEPNIIPSSPESSSLGKYGSYPVSPYTGVPSISIPLYELKAGEISLPISLNYHASGIRVDDISSWVGLGWSLNAGGCISVETRGRPDILPKEYDENGNPYEMNVYPRIHSVTFNEFLDDDVCIKEYISFENIEGLAETNNTDSEPDIYNYNVGNFSGQFLMTEDRKIKFIKNNDGIKASFIASDTSFKFIDKNGKIYMFKNKEITAETKYRWGLENNVFKIWYSSIWK